MQVHAMLIDARPDLLDELMSLVIATIESRDLGALRAHCERIAEDRFNQGFDISEVQAAFNALEEAMWRHVPTLDLSALFAGVNS